MIEINISTLKNQLSAILKKVRRGEEVLVMDRNEPVAKLVRAGASDKPHDEEAHLLDLERRGIITRATKKKASANELRKNLVSTLNGVSAVEVLLQERREAKY